MFKIKLVAGIALFGFLLGFLLFAQQLSDGIRTFEDVLHIATTISLSLAAIPSFFIILGVLLFGGRKDNSASTSSNGNDSNGSSISSGETYGSGGCGGGDC